ncbi:SAM-dependent methyltransferase [Dactylosporangium sp. AC04546]|uniref:SAM-dependent methyltransferase n=1 Tax=Dactylosporangium sp. AC04546 TaxID=2862460 RepID=UPI001EDF580D|nr:SAM-dependent methyltransferase [Dactylosporangium sp. AC04546]WVK85339.1 SAM-dependent methyltransferase [Dactylosporangium sp. AC04546]
MSGADWMKPKPDAAKEPVDLQTDRPHPARVYDYLLGGKDNFPADRTAAEAGLKANPNSRMPPRENRNFLRRAVEYLAREQGIRQFLDIGTGIPTSPNVHEVAQAIAPDSRIVYVDNDPIVLAHARALLTSKPEGRTEYIDADLRDVDRILNAPALREVIDFNQPVGLLLIAIMHFVGDADKPYEIVERLVDALPSGSFLTLTHLTGDFDAAAWDRVAAIYAKQGVTMQVRPHDDIARFFTGLELVEPGLPIVTKWRPDADVNPDATDTQVAVYGGMARKA